MHSNDSQRWPDHERALPDATVAAAGPTDSTAATPKQSSQHPDPYSKSDGPLTTTTSREATPPVDPKAHRSPTSLPQDVVEKIKDVQADPYRVVFEPNDPDDPKNWNELRKWQIMIVTLALQIWANNISATVAPGLPLIAQDFNVSPAASRVVQATYLYGFACGPVLTAPLSEDFGRVPVMLLGGLGMGLFQLHCALSPNYGSLLVARFLAGFFAAATFNSVGTVADLWIPERQGWGVNGFALSAELGVVIASVYSGFLVQRTGGWRWLFGVTGIVTGFLLLLFALTVPETNNGVLLSRRARRLRKSTGDDRYFSDHDRAREARTRMDTIREVIIRPAHMLITEPIVSAFAAFDGYNYCIIYLLVEAAPVIYTDYHGFSMPFQSFAFIGMGVGFIVAFLCYPIPQAIVRRAARKSPTGVPEPESLLKWGLFVSPCFPISIFWFAWTIQPSVPWIVSMVALGLFGFSSHVIFLFVSDYTVAAYGDFSASAVAGESLAREIMSGSAALVAEPMFHNLPSYEWAACTLAFIALPLAFIPFLLYKAGPWLRLHSPFAKQIALASKDLLHSPSSTLHA